MDGLPQIAFLGLVTLAAFGPRDHKPLPAADDSHKAAAVTSWLPWGHEEPVSHAVSGDPLVSASGQFGVPSWYLHSTWKVESDLMQGECGTSKNWPLAADLAKPGSACEVNTGHEWCQKQWAALKAICKQVSKSGSQVCDPETVRTSWAFAMGPMQILPTNILKVSEGGTAWTDNASDFDGDGTVNPLAVPDAMAMAAKLSRRFHDKHGYSDDLEGWMKTSERYLGGESADRRAKILGHAEKWCESHECGSYREEIASR